MKAYEPSFNPDPEAWLSIDEGARISLVREYHENSGEDDPEVNLELHSSIHVVVENQLAMKVDCIPETIAKLTRQGLARHEAIHAIGAIISEDLVNLAQGVEREFSPNKFRRKLEKLTAKRWRKGQY